MAEQEGNREPLPAVARWAAVVVLGLAGVLGIARAWIAPRPVALDPSPPGFAAGAPEHAGDAPPPGVSRPSAPAPPSAVRRINVNTATAAELDLLPGIGPALAASIIEDREANGPFKSLDDLDRVPGIGPKTVAKLVHSATVE